MWSTTGAMLTGVDFTDSEEGWVVGGGVHDGTSWLDSARILHTTDGGLTWAQESVAVDKWIMGISVVDRQHVWTIGDGGTIQYRTEQTSYGADSSIQLNDSETFIDYDVLGRTLTAAVPGIRIRVFPRTGRSELLALPGNR